MQANDPSAQQVKYGSNNLPADSSLTMLNKSEAMLRLAYEDSCFILVHSAVASTGEQMCQISINIHAVFPK